MAVTRPEVRVAEPLGLAVERRTVAVQPLEGAWEEMLAAVLARAVEIRLWVEALRLAVA